ncbi:peptidylprolyl isomerase [Pseudanabaena sp. PCC 6802]|uniref:peptidylprolyl isomerase n=1 Tax=Pseudanabaena sp. PCC 6802 TaxID=118173 RepID=UPI00034CE9BD|nr:peptidylprolyl isomerase [Pseudanabaena sp. PCC 6802]
MSKPLSISSLDILNQVKLSCQIPIIVEGIVGRKILRYTAAEAGITVEPEELQQAADSIRLVNNLRRTEDTWQWLQKYGLTLDEFEEIVYGNVISSKLAQHLFEKKIEQFFIEHQLDYAQVVMYEIVLDDEDLAIELFYALKEDEISFHAAAHQYIQDKELRRSCGYRGILNRKDLKPEISAAVFAANPPQILKPILTSLGTHLILVEEIIQPQLDPPLRLKILSDMFTEWLKYEISQFDIEIDFETKH